MIVLIITLAIYVLTTVGGLVALKAGAKHRPPIAYRNRRLVYNFNPKIRLGLVLYAVSFFSYIYLLSKYDLGFIIPVAAAFVYIVLFTASYVIFKETFTTRKVLGLSLLILGILLLGADTL